MVLFSKALFQNGSVTHFAEWARRTGAELFELGQTLAPTRSQHGILVTQDHDHHNFQALKDDKNLRLLMPIREDQMMDDMKKALAFLEKGSVDNKSIIRANHKTDGSEKSFRMISSDERWKAIDAFGAYIESQPVFASLSEIGKTVASELLTNAFYNAPQDQQGRALQPRRSEVSEITPPSEVTFTFGDDGEHIWLAVTDPFGTFSRDKLLDHLMRCSRSEKMTVREGVGGAGIGLYMVYKWASQLLFEFSRGQQTTVMVKLLKTKRMKIFESQRTIFEVVDVSSESEHKVA